MRRPLTWLFLALIGSSLSTIASGCADNEASPQDGTGGSGGTGGQGGEPSTSTTSVMPTGRTTGSGGAVNTGLGTGCLSDADCATGLSCFRSDRDSLGPGGPAHGLCTIDCGVSDSPTENDAVCQEFDANSLCFPFAEDGQYCIQGCTPGPETNKCQLRGDVMCRPIIHDIEGPECSSDGNCGVGEGCYDIGDGGRCFAETTACVPQCNIDDDCTAGRYCDVGLGLCVGDEPTSKRFGEECDPDAEVDECAGFCNPDTGICQELCTLGVYPACGSESTTNGDAACLLVSSSEVTVGDAGQCGKLCDCNDDCFGDFSCLKLEDDMGPYEILGRPGICFTASPGEPVLSECGGEGGAGGQGGSTGDQ